MAVPSREEDKEPDEDEEDEDKDVSAEDPFRFMRSFFFIIFAILHYCTRVMRKVIRLKYSYDKGNTVLFRIWRCERIVLWIIRLSTGRTFPI